MAGVGVFDGRGVPWAVARHSAWAARDGTSVVTFSSFRQLRALLHAVM